MTRGLVHKLKHGTALLLVMGALLLTYAPSPLTPRAEALFGAGDTVVVVGGTGTLQEKISAGANLITSGNSLSLWMKESVLDPIAWMAANMLIEQMSKSIVSWINSGFEGSPSFVTNLDQFLLGVADATVGDFIWNTDELQFLCSPFALDIKWLLEFQYRSTRDFGNQYRCTLTDVIGNVDNFLSGTFSEGGWDGWFEVVTNPVNNPYSAVALAESQLALQVKTAKSREQEQLAWGQGFIGVRDCSSGVCQTVTPGAVIEEQLNNTLGSGQRRLEVADEFNEIIGALFGQLVHQVFDGAGGLLGLTTNAGGSAGDYYDRIANESFETTSSISDPIQSMIDDQNQYIGFAEQGIALIEKARSYPVDRYGRDGIDYPFDANLERKVEELRAGVVAAEAYLSELETLRVDYEILSSEEALGALSGNDRIALFEYYGGTNAPEAKLGLMEQVASLRSEVFDQVDIITLEFAVSPGGDIYEAVENYKARVDADLECLNGACSA